jgi:hypothetical protein
MRLLASRPPDSVNLPPPCWKTPRNGLLKKRLVALLRSQKEQYTRGAKGLD